MIEYLIEDENKKIIGSNRYNKRKYNKKIFGFKKRMYEKLS